MLVLLIFVDRGLPGPGSAGICNESEVYGRWVRGQHRHANGSVWAGTGVRYSQTRPLFGYCSDNAAYSLGITVLIDNDCGGTNTWGMTAQFAASSATLFDPTAGRFIAQARRPASWSDVDPASLTPLMRALLVIDGTVTKILEAYFLEPVDVQRISQSTDTLDAADVWLDADAGERIVNREVVLVGRESQRVYTYAQSTIMRDRLTGRMEAGLDADNFGLGRILLDSAAEMRRECLWYGRQRLANPPPPMAAHVDEALVSRTYRVIQGGSSLMMITERFPPDVSNNPIERRR